MTNPIDCQDPEIHGESGWHYCHMDPGPEGMGEETNRCLMCDNERLEEELEEAREKKDFLESQCPKERPDSEPGFTQEEAYFWYAQADKEKNRAEQGELKIRQAYKAGLRMAERSSKNLARAHRAEKTTEARHKVITALQKELEHHKKVFPREREYMEAMREARTKAQDIQCRRDFELLEHEELKEKIGQLIVLLDLGPEQAFRTAHHLQTAMNILAEAASSEMYPDCAECLKTIQFGLQEPVPCTNLAQISSKLVENKLDCKPICDACGDTGEVVFDYDDPEIEATVKATQPCPRGCKS